MCVYVSVYCQCTGCSGGMCVYMLVYTVSVLDAAEVCVCVYVFVHRAPYTDYMFIHMYALGTSM